MPEFPHVEIKRQNGESVPVHLYGVAHGIGMKGTQMDVATGRALKDEGKKFGENDYLISEGTDERLIRHLAKVAGAKFVFSRHFLKETINPHIPRVSTAEDIEHFEFFRKAVVDPTMKIERAFHTTVREGVKQRLERVEKLRGKTTAESDEIAEANRDLVEELVKRGVEREKAEIQVESQTTFRSLLMARAAYHRAYATGLPVRLFVGFAHTREIKDFLSDEEKVNEYVAKLPTTLKDLYYAYERHGWRAVDLFEEHAHKFEPGFHSKFFAWIALEIAKAQYSGKNAVLDLAQFRRAVGIKKEV